jgi:putative DNA primase/helicase
VNDNARAFADIVGLALESEPILIKAGELARLVDLLHAKLIPSGVYQRSGFIVRPAMVQGKDRLGNTVLTPGIRSFDATALVLHLQRFLRFERINARGEAVACDLPQKFANALLGLYESLKLHVLRGVVTLPVLYPDGRVLDRPGYDEKSGLYFDPLGTPFPVIPDKPTRRDALRALVTLRKPLKEYPFKFDAEKGESRKHNRALSGALCYLLSIVNRSAYDRVPVFGFDGNRARVGKGKLVSLGSIMATGDSAAVIRYSLSAEEFEKQLVTCLLSGTPQIHIDNVDRPLDSATLCSGVAEDWFVIRKFGELTNIRVANEHIISVTGNKLVVAGDLAPRTLMIEIVSPEEDPELAPHSFDPVAYGRQRRGELVVAAQTLLRAHILAGRPHQPPNEAEKAKTVPLLLGSFEEWSMGPPVALAWLGEPNPISTIGESKARDPKRQRLLDLVETWDDAAKQVGELLCPASYPRSVAELIKLAEDFIDKDNNDVRSFHEALEAIGTDKKGDLSKKKIGWYLRNHMDMKVGGKTIRQEPSTRRRASAKWYLEGGSG